MAGVLAPVWFAAAIGGALAAVVGLFTNRARRHASLMIAGVCFGVAGILGILSVGIIFVALSVASFVAANRTDDAAAEMLRAGEQ